jgi:hypothetical protein
MDIPSQNPPLGYLGDTRMRSSRLVGTVVSVMVLAAGLSACQDPNDPSPENTPALAGPAKKASARHALRDPGLRRMTRTQVLHALSVGPTKKKWAHLDTSIKAPRFTISGRGDMAYSPTSPAVRLEVVGSCLCFDNVEVLVTNGIYYVNIPALTGSGYARIDPRSPGSPLGPDFAKISNELDSLSVLLDERPAFRKVHYTGHRELYGHRMSSYTLVVDTRAGLAARGLSVYADKLPPKIVYHMWFDPHHLLRKMTWKVNRIRFSTEMSEWGKPVHLKAPGPRKLVDLGGKAA